MPTKRIHEQNGELDFGVECAGLPALSETEESGGKPPQSTMKSSFVRICSLALAIAACAAPAVAQNYSLTGHTLGGGGGSSAGGTYLVSGTIGQPAAGTVGAGNYTIAGGFWALIGTVQTPGAPLIHITMTSTNVVLVAWPSPSTGFILQQNTASTGTNWVNVAQSPVDNGKIRSVLVSPPTANLFFRLKK